eukprot:scaffold12036_cov61-Phaeocystis_antarctica.AAC.1
MRDLVQRCRSKLEVEELHRERPASGAVPMVGERAHLDVLAGCVGPPLGGSPVVGERVRAAGVRGAVAVRGNLRPRAKVCIARVDLDAFRKEWGARGPVRGTGLSVAATPGVRVVKREDEVDVVGAVHAVSAVREEQTGRRRVARIRQW